MTDARLESLIEAASKLKDAVVRLGEAYAVMPAVIEKEHKAIRSSDFFSVQAAIETKEEACGRVEAAFAEMTRAADCLASFRETPGGRPRSLKECVAVLQELADQAAPAEGLGPQVLRHQVDGLARVAKDFEERFSKIKPQIEANRALVTSMLHNFQESYRFWQEIAEEVATAYNARGVQQSKGRNSGFAVKA